MSHPINGDGNLFHVPKRIPLHMAEAIVRLIIGLLFVAIMPLTARAAGHPEKLLVGAVEEVILLPWGVKVPARIDTGASSSSLDVCEVKVVKKQVYFTLADRCGGIKTELPLAGRRYVQSAGGGQRRPVVEIEICLGTKRIRTKVTLTDRANLEYPFLVGRNTLEGNFIVDVSRSNTVPPNCPDEIAP